jgi:hypothetical protein
MISWITPEKIVESRRSSTPDSVYQAMNNLIAENYANCSTVVKVDELKVEILRLMGINTKILDHWLDVEPIFADHGWDLKLVSPTGNQSFPPYWKCKYLKALDRGL